MEYTKGPWEYVVGSTNYVDGGRYEGCYRGVIHGGKLNMALAVMVADCLQDEVEANAHLIAAAPAMREALKFITTGKRENGGYDKHDAAGFIRIAEDALAKAEGK